MNSVKYNAIIYFIIITIENKNNHKQWLRILTTLRAPVNFLKRCAGLKSRYALIAALLPIIIL